MLTKEVRMPVWAVASLELAVGTVMAAAIAVVGLWTKANYATPAPSPNHLFDYGVWFCVYGIFGNGCFQ